MSSSIQPHPGALQTLFESAAGSPLPEWPHAAAAITVQQVAPGETVFLQDAVHPYLHAVQRGLLKLSYLKSDGTEWIKSFAHDGGFFASVSALRPGGRTSFMVVAMEPSTLERIDHRVLEELASRHLAWSRALQVMTLVFAARKEQRERELLTLAPMERYLAFCDAHPNLEKRVPQKDLARHLGVTPVGLNRIVMRVRRAG